MARLDGNTAKSPFSIIELPLPLRPSHPIHTYTPSRTHAHIRLGHIFIAGQPRQAGCSEHRPPHCTHGNGGRHDRRALHVRAMILHPEGHRRFAGSGCGAPPWDTSLHSRQSLMTWYDRVCVNQAPCCTGLVGLVCARYECKFLSTGVLSVSCPLAASYTTCFC